MSTTILLAHANGEEEIAAKIAQPLRNAGYEVWDHDSVLIGESINEEASKLLAGDVPVVMCATIKALGTKWARMVINAARRYPSVKIFIMQMDQEADVDTISFGESVGKYWEDPRKAVDDLITALKQQSPLYEGIASTKVADFEKNYVSILLKSCDIINLANLPETDRYRVTQQLELRKLYVALRVQLEISSEDEPNSQNIADIESRREILKQGKDQWSNFNQDLTGFRRNRFHIGERLAVNRSLVVLGDPGSGKTTLLRWIATAYILRMTSDRDWDELPDVLSLPSENWLPILIRCRDFNQNSPPTSLEDLLRHNLKRAEISDAEAVHLVPRLVQKLRDAKAILLIDGVDEITDITARASFCKQIEQMRLAHPDAPFIVTARIVGYREMGQRIGRGFEHLTVSELSKEDKDEFARLWCNLTEVGERRHEATSELIREIHSMDRIERLTTNPMLLTTIALVKRKVGRLPSHRVDLYGDALAVLLNWRREVDQPLDWYEAVPQLGYIAYSMCNQGVLQLRRDEILQLLHSIRTEYPSLYPIHTHTPEQFLNLLERLTGVLTQVGTVRHIGLSMPVYEFRHLTFQEYLAARALIDGCYPNRDRTKTLAETVAPLAGRLADDKDSSPDRDVTVSESWSETLRLCIAACPNDDVDRVIQAIAVPYHDEDSRTTKRPRAVLASLCLADDPNVTEDVAAEVIRELVGEIDQREGNEGSPTSVKRAVKEVSKSRWAGVLKSTLLETFFRTNSVHRSSLSLLYEVVVRAAVNLKEEIAREAFVDTKLSQLVSEDERGQVDAVLSINAVSKQHQIAAPQILIEALLSRLSASTPVAFASASTLATLNSSKQQLAIWRPLRRELEVIIQIILADDFDASVVKFLLSIVGRERDPKGLKAGLSKLADPELQLSAIEALGYISGEETASRLIPFLSSDQLKLKLAAVEALGNLRDENSIGPLVLQLNDGADEVRAAIAEVLGHFHSQQVIAALMERLDDPSSEVRVAVLNALSTIGKAEYSDIYISKLNDASGNVRALAAGCLGDSKDPRTLNILLPKLTDQDDNVRAAVAIALGHTGDASVVQPLINLLSTDNDTVYFASAISLGQIKDRAALSPLIEGLDSPHFTRKLAAALALGLMGEPSTLDLLMTKLADKREKFPSLLAWPIGQIKDPRAFEALCELLKVSDDSVRATAVGALGEIQDTRAVDPLVSCLIDPSDIVRASAVSALINFDDRRIPSLLIDATKDPNLQVKIAAIESLKQFDNPDAISRLIELVDDYSVSIRQATVKSLGKMKAQPAVPSLLSRLNQENRIVKGMIIEALLELQDTRAVMPLMDIAREDEDEKIRSLASSALYSIGVAQFVLGNVDQSTEIFLELTEIEPADNHIHNSLAFLFMLQGNYTSANEELGFVDFEEVSADRPLFQNNRALLTFLRGNPQKAKKQLRKALRWIGELGSEYDPHRAAVVLLLTSPQSVSSHKAVPIDVAVLINLYLMNGLSRIEVSEELAKRLSSNHDKWEKLLNDVESKFFQSENVS